MASPTLKLGALQNKITAGNEQEQARNMALANNLQLGAQLISGQGFQAGMSPFEQVAQGALLGASQGFKNKAEMKKAQAQDELNAFVQKMQENELQLQQATQQEEREQAAIKKASVPAMVALTQYKETGDKAGYEARLRAIGSAFARDLGSELVNLHLSPDSDQVVIMTLKDLDGDGQQDTQEIDLAELVGAATEINKDIGTVGMQALGLNPPKAKGEDVTFEQFQSFTPEQQALYKQYTGKGGKSDSASWGDNDKQAAKDLAKLAAELNKKDYIATASLADGAAERLIETGLDVNWLTKNNLVQGIASLGLTGPEAKREAEIWSVVESVLQELTLPKVKSLGAGTGISNADREFASKIVNKDNDTTTTILQKMALQKAIAEVQQEFKNLQLDADALSGEFEGMTPSQAKAALRVKMKEIENRPENDPRGVAVKAAKYEQDYLQRFTAKKNPEAARQVQERQMSSPTTTFSPEELKAIEEASKDISEAELEAIAAGAQ